jgi:hypothetical protein
MYTKSLRKYGVIQDMLFIMLEVELMDNKGEVEVKRNWSVGKRKWHNSVRRNF